MSTIRSPYMAVNTMNVNDRYVSPLERYVRLGVEVARERGIVYLASYEVRSDVDILLTKANHLYSYLYAKIFNRPLIHVIGDSHSWAFKRNRPFIIHNIGPATAYNLINKNSTVRSNEKLFDIIGKIDLKRDMVILVFGEIDSRVHFYNQHKKSDEKVSIDELMDKTISNYGEVLGQLDSMGVSFFVYGILPAPRNIMRYPTYATEKMKEELFNEFKANYPYLAPAEARSRMNKQFNDKLKRFCQDKGYRYIDIYPVVADGDGFISDDYAADEIHVNGRIMPFIKGVLTKKYNISFEG
jgi:hypothetical protein